VAEMGSEHRFSGPCTRRGGLSRGSGELVVWEARGWGLERRGVVLCGRVKIEILGLAIGIWHWTRIRRASLQRLEDYWLGSWIVDEKGRIGGEGRKLDNVWNVMGGGDENVAESLEAKE
jgi:hypothetical protein